MIYSILIVVLVYVGVSFASVIAVKGVGEPAWVWIGKFGEKGFGEAISRLIPFGGFLTTIAVIFASTSALNATIYSGTRVSYALGRDRMLPPIFSRLSKKKGSLLSLQNIIWPPDVSSKRDNPDLDSHRPF